MYQRGTHTLCRRGNEHDKMRAAARPRSSFSIETPPESQPSAPKHTNGGSSGVRVQIKLNFDKIAALAT